MREISSRGKKCLYFFVLLFSVVSFFPLSGKEYKIPPASKTSVPPEPDIKKEKKSSGSEKNKTIKKQIRIPAEQQKFFRELSIVLDSLRKHSPHAGKIVDEQLKTDSLAVIRDFFQRKNAGIACVTVEEGKKGVSVQVRKKSGGNKSVFHREKLSGGRIGYINLPDFSAAGTKKCMEALDDFSGSCAGIVLDLRKCNDYTPQNPDLVIRRLREFVLKKNSSNGYKVSLALIAGKETKGNGEILVHILRKLPGVISAGAATHGQPFILKALPLKIIHAPVSGAGGKKINKKIMHIFAPVIPDKWKDIPPVSIAPQIRTETAPVYEKGNIPVEKDPALRVVSDLILSMDVLHGTGSTKGKK